MDGKEEWRSVPGHGDVFVASSLGRIARVVGHSAANGYRQISFKRAMKPFKASGASKKWPDQLRGYAHHLVALAFLGEPPEGKTQINHKDNDRSNNRPDNLEWSNQTENVRHAWATGRISRTRLKKISLYTKSEIIELRKRGLSYPQIAKRACVHPTTVGYQVRSAILRGDL
jgi:hypothetical protein